MPRKYRMTIIRFNPEPASVTETFSSCEAASAWLGTPTDIECCIESTAWLGRSCIGDFYLWCSGEYAVAQIGEHREHNATNLDGALLIVHPVLFRDEDGSLYTPAPEQVLSRELAMRALHEWLVDFEHPSFLRWS